MSPRRRTALAAALAAALCAPSAGCITLVSSSKGSPIEPSRVERLRAGHTTLPQVLSLLGAPLEVHQHADGRLLVYRHRQRNTFRLGIQPGQALSLIDLSQVAAQAAGNLSLTVERIHSGEDRLVILLDHDDVVQAVGYHAGAADVPVF